MQANNPKLAGFDWRGFAVAVEQKRRADNHTVRGLADDLGLTAKDVSMAGGGHVIGVAKVHALLKWLDLPLDHFDIAPMADATETTCYGRSNVKHAPASHALHELARAVPSQPPEDIDVTHFQSPGRTRETKPGMKSVADYSLELQYWPGSPTDVLLMELADLTSAGSREIVLLEITPNGGSTWVFQAYLNEYVPSSAVGDKQMVNAEWKVMARVIAVAAPTNTLLPSISGIAQDTEILTAIEGSWTGAPVFTYVWQEDDGGGYDAIVGATSRTYTVATANVGNPIRVVVTGTNAEGSDSATSASTADVIAA